MIDENSNPLELDCNGIMGVTAFALTEYIFAFYKKVPGEVHCYAGMEAHVALRVFGMKECLGWFFENRRPDRLVTPYGDADFFRDRKTDDCEARFCELGSAGNILILKNLKLVFL